MWERMPENVNDAELNNMRSSMGAPQHGCEIDQLQARLCKAVEEENTQEVHNVRRELTRLALGDEAGEHEMVELPPQTTLSPFGRCNQKGSWEWISGPIRQDIRNMGSDDFEAIVVEIL
jgi:hypothetical protein